jgi:hypothetical protein
MTREESQKGSGTKRSGGTGQGTVRVKRRRVDEEGERDGPNWREWVTADAKWKSEDARWKARLEHGIASQIGLQRGMLMRLERMVGLLERMAPEESSMGEEVPEEEMKDAEDGGNGGNEEDGAGGVEGGKETEQETEETEETEEKGAEEAEETGERTDIEMVD